MVARQQCCTDPTCGSLMPLLPPPLPLPSATYPPCPITHPPTYTLHVLVPPPLPPCPPPPDLASGAVTQLASGHDFFSSPAVSPDGTHLAYVAWDHPNMVRHHTIPRAGCTTLRHICCRRLCYIRFTTLSHVEPFTEQHTPQHLNLGTGCCCAVCSGLVRR